MKWPEGPWLYLFLTVVLLAGVYLFISEEAAEWVVEKIMAGISLVGNTFRTTIGEKS